MTSLVAALALPALADDKDDLERMRKEANSGAQKAKKDLDASTKELVDASNKLKNAQGQLDAAQAKLGQTRGQVAVAKAFDQEMQVKLAKGEAALEKARNELKRSERRVAKSAAAVEELAVQEILRGDGRLQAVSDLLRGGGTQTFGDDVAINRAVADERLATMQRLDATRVMLKLKRQEVQKMVELLRIDRAQAAENLVQMQALEAAAAEQATVVASLVKKRESARKVAAKAQAEDERQYQEFRSEAASLEARIQQMLAEERRRAEAGSKGGKGGGSSSNAGGDSGGTLSYPVNGPITSQYGMRVHPVTGVYKLHDGTDFGVGCGTPIRAAASGTVMDQYYNGAYGNRVILNNDTKRGVSVVTTYNHLSRFAVSAGSKVSRGQVIGYVGSTGYSTGCHLHFMVLANGVTTNPMNWL